MKIESVNNKHLIDNRIVDYFGISLVVPKWTLYVAVDEFGEMIACSEKPYRKDYSWYSDTGGLLKLDYRIFFENHKQTWRDSLVEYEPEPMAPVNNYKTVTYFGAQLQVPQVTKYLATNRDGSIMAFDERPSDDVVYGYDYDWSVEKYACAMPVGFCRLKNHSEEWKNSLVEVE